MNDTTKTIESDSTSTDSYVKNHIFADLNANAVMADSLFSEGKKCRKVLSECDSLNTDYDNILKVRNDQLIDKEFQVGNLMSENKRIIRNNKILIGVIIVVAVLGFIF